MGQTVEDASLKVDRKVGAASFLHGLEGGGASFLSGLEMGGGGNFNSRG